MFSSGWLDIGTEWQLYCSRKKQLGVIKKMGPFPPASVMLCREDRIKTVDVV